MGTRAAPGVFLEGPEHGPEMRERQNVATGNQGQTALSVSDAGRFLRRATFGPSYADLKSVQDLGIERWLAGQFTAPRLDSHAAFIERGGPPRRTRQNPKERFSFFETFWYQAALGEDQLRQRMAFALSQIFVVSFEEPSLSNDPRSVGHYMDMLADNAFGNFRTLLTRIALSPAMGEYLSFIANERADPNSGRQPDENFAREVMQLFTIGLWELQPNGQPKLDASGALIPTYGQEDIRGMARVFTGWSWGGGPLTDVYWRGGRIKGQSVRQWDAPMNVWPDKHEFGAKTIVGGIKIPRGAKAEDSMARALDVLFYHPNTAPFICRQLIQRFVTSNPSPDYVQRVAQVFADNGNGVRGDLAAVIVAILLDPEAWWPTGQVPTAGKLREPVLRIAQWMRAFGEPAWFESEPLGRSFSLLAGAIGQQPLQAPSVFNWYTPDFAPAGEIASAGLAAPEFKLYDDSAVAGYTNTVVKIARRGIPGFKGRRHKTTLSYPLFGDLPNDPDQFVTLLNQLLCANTLSAESFALIRDAIASIPETGREERIWTGIAMTMLAPDYMVET